MYATVEMSAVIILKKIAVALALASTTSLKQKLERPKRTMKDCVNGNTTKLRHELANYFHWNMNHQLLIFAIFNL